MDGPHQAIRPRVDIIITIIITIIFTIIINN